jgi:hypothetical protein
VSSPLTLSHDLSDPAQYDAAWPIVSNKQALRVNQAFVHNDAGRLVGRSSPASDMKDLILYHGAGCECVWPGQSLPRWTVWAKRISATEAAVLAINFSNETVPAGSIVVPLDQIFGTQFAGGIGGEAVGDDAGHDAGHDADVPTGCQRVYEQDVWQQEKRTAGAGRVFEYQQPRSRSSTGDDASPWNAPELSRRSSFFAVLTSAAARCA